MLFFMTSFYLIQPILSTNIDDLLNLNFNLLPPTKYNMSIPPGPLQGPSIPIFSVNDLSLSAQTAPKLASINATVFDWWYFDALSSTNPNTSVVITLFSTAALAFPFLDPSESSVLIAYIWTTFPNGTIYASYAPASVATVSSTDGINRGTWTGTGMDWTGDETGHFEVRIEDEELMGMKGVVVLDAITPPYTPCSTPTTCNPSLEIAPHFGWTNVIPDAIATVDMVVTGETVRFTGYGYHDKNWSDKPFLTTVSSWYWGHAHFGPYSIVWFSYLSLTDNKTYVSGYVAKDSQPILSGCDDGIVTVRPMVHGQAAAYPPRKGDVPDGFQVVFNEQLKINVSVGVMVAGDGEYYLRWTGRVKGEVGGEVWEGVGVFEQFVMQ